MTGTGGSSAEGLGWAAARRIARAEWRASLSGLKTLVACLVIGVLTIGGVDSLQQNLKAGVADNGRRLLAGDLQVSRLQQPLQPEIRRMLERFGTVQAGVRLNTNIRVPGGARPALALLRAVDEHYPLYGRVRLDPPMPLMRALAEEDGAPGIVLAPELADRLGVAPGAEILVGRSRFILRALLVDEPDRLAAGMRLGPSAMIALKEAERTGLLSVGSLATYSYRLRLDPAAPPVDVVRERLVSAFPDAGLRVTTAGRAAPGLKRFLDRFGHFLLLVSLTALLLGGIGVANAVGAYLLSREEAIATLKLLGADRGTILRGYGFVLAGIVACATVIGLLGAAAVPFAVKSILAAVLPVPYTPRIVWPALAFAGLAGILVAAAFALVPLMRAAALPAGRLWRRAAAEERWRDRRVVLMSAGLVLLLGAAAVLRAPQPAFAAIFVAGSAVAIAGLWALAKLLPWLLGRILVRPRGALKIALAHILRPGARSASIMLSLGVGLVLFATLALVEANLSAGIRQDLGARAPNFFFLDIPKAERARFAALARRFADGEDGLQLVPSLRGRIVKLNGRPADPAAVAPEVRWVLRGDRGVTFSADVPPGNRLAAGRWWPRDYDGPPLVSLAAEEAQGLGLDLGDTVTVNVLGREVTATVASLRDLSWRSAGLNFVLVFDPATFAAAPFTYLASLRTPDLAQEEAAYRALTDAFPEVTAVRVRDVLQSIEQLLLQMADAIRMTAALTILAGIIVLIGAIAAEERLRRHEAAVFKLLGATRGEVVRAFVVELAVIGGLAAVLAFLVAAAAARFVVVEALDLAFAFSAVIPAATLAVGMGASLFFGGLIGWRSLGARPAELLRAG